MSVLDLPQDEFLAALPELAQQGIDTDYLIRLYRERNSAFAGVNAAANADAQRMADAGRRPVMGGFFSKEIGTTGWDAIRSLQTEFTSGIRGGLAGVGQAIEAPSAAASGLIPEGDMALEALGTSGMASLGGAAMARPRGSVGMGGRVVADALPEPRNAAERMARDILEMRAQGRAREVTDDMMAQADPQYMFNNTPLPMDEASRLGRAGGAGLVDSQYHATMADFQAFLPSQTGLVGRGVYSGDFADGISDYARAGYTTTDGLNIIPMVTPSDATYARRIDWQNTIDADDEFPYNATPDETIEGFRRAADNMSAQGLSGVRSQDGERVTFDPRNIRSRFARFDPEFSHLSNLSAANVSALSGLGSVLASDIDALAGMTDPQEIAQYIDIIRARDDFARGYRPALSVSDLYGGGDR